MTRVLLSRFIIVGLLFWGIPVVFLIGLQAFWACSRSSASRLVV
jgi:hypothetical protein